MDIGAGFPKKVTFELRLEGGCVGLLPQVPRWERAMRVERMARRPVCLGQGTEGRMVAKEVRGIKGVRQEGHRALCPSIRESDAVLKTHCRGD